MQKLMKITFNLLREMVKENLSQIQVNQKKILQLFKTTRSDSKNKALEAAFEQNKVLLAENMALIYSQLSITESSKKKSEIIFRDVNDCLELTMAGFMVYHKEKFNGQEDKFLNLLNDYSRQLRKFTGTERKMQ